MKNLKSIISICCIALLTSCAQRLSPSNVEEFSLRVMSYNIHHANPPSAKNKIDIDAITRVIKLQDPDLVALQEVDVNTVRSGKINEASLLAEKLGMNFFFAKSIDHDGGEYGVAILSKYPITGSSIHRLPTKEGTKGEPRVLATSVINLPDHQKILFGSTHLDAQQQHDNRLLQVAEIVRIGKQEVLPFLLAGDLNATPGSEPIKLFDEQFVRTCETCAFTIPEVNPNRTIDFIAFNKSIAFDVVSHQVIDEQYASDHLPIVSVLKIKRNKRI